MSCSRRGLPLAFSRQSLSNPLAILRGVPVRNMDYWVIFPILKKK
jgi:hypothetical protein